MATQGSGHGTRQFSIEAPLEAIADESLAVVGEQGASAEFCGVVEELRPAPDAEQVFLRFAALPHCLYLDSARRDPQLGRFSFVTADPFDFVEIASPTDGDVQDAFAVVEQRLAGLFAPTIPDLPPFQGGAAGLFSYDLSRQIERLPPPRIDEFKTPVMAIGLYDTVVAFDHATERAWIISQGLPELDPARRRRRAHERLEQFRRWLDANDSTPRSRISARPLPPSDFEPIRKRHAERGTVPFCSEDSTKGDSPRPFSVRLLAPQFETEQDHVAANPTGLLTSNFAAEQYLDAVRRAIEYIHAGDVFQVNLSQRLLHPATDDPVALYLRLRRRNPATFAAYFDLGEFQIASASPERFLQVVEGQVEARPIKGTRRRIARPEADLFAGDELRESEKDNAENVMIVDLLRNDLSRVCRPESVVVSDLCRLETYEFVQHLVSVVRGQLREGATALDLLRAAFPGGSVTGAPKVRAMEIIAELEPTARGPYCGALGYIGFDGSMDTNILIRTITAGRGWWQMPVGGGIVAQSDPQREYEETWHKAEGMLRALE
ncbi:MAG TPA: aminodeoxychorismate synthase component I [Pirellulales bacterium]|jgi:para-aminobenzoate synthetase component 1|nr:aminodeoxychorismate synthase component I [Pirellulales bacterium]